MKELAKRFIGQDCIIYTLASNDGSLQGKIREVEGTGLVLERNDGNVEIVNLEFVTRIRRYPVNRKGKKKSVVID